jgi:hypothetical protein
VINRKTKGQGLVEFALILPLLLLLLLGIIEGGRIIWAYVTVQNAAREAARYAVTGRPFACGTDPAGSPSPTAYCDDATRGDPWATQVYTTTRVKAIKDVARTVGKNLSVSTWADTDLNVYNAHKNTAGAFGIAVIGQSAVYTKGLGNFGGEPGWNVRVETYYNVEMIDPIYDVVMGGQIIHLAGRVELQNEGIDVTVKQYVGGIASDVADNCYVTGTCGGGSSPFITVIDEGGDFIEPAGGNFSVAINDHIPNMPYILFFTNGPFVQQIPFTTDGLGGKIQSVTISVAAPTTPVPPPAGSHSYKIYTALASAPTSPIATCLGDIGTNAPCFSVSKSAATIVARNIGGTVSYGGDSHVQEQQPVTPARWPISSSIPIYIYGHNVNTNYTILFNGLDATAAPGFMTFLGAGSNIIRTDSQLGGNQNGEPAYYIAEKHSAGPVAIESRDPANTSIATTSVELVTTAVDIAGETPTRTHPEDDALTITFRNHAPRQEYQIWFNDGVSPYTTQRADANGNLLLLYVVPHGVHEPGTPPVKVKIYTLDYGRGPNTNIIAQRTITVSTPISPYINIPGGARWPAGSPITIQLRRHLPNTDYQVRIEQGAPGSTTFSQLINGVTYRTSTNSITGLGEKDIDYTIPFNFSGNYVIRSYLPSDLTRPVASFDIQVTANPSITIDNGIRWPPGASIVVRLVGHSNSTPYDVWLDKGGPRETFLGPVITNNSGEATIKYTIPTTMPSKISPEFYPIHSYLSDKVVANNGKLEVYPADLTITKIDLPSSLTFDIEQPITLTVKNNNPVTITNAYFDTDIYIDPTIAPNPLNNGLPPGDRKTWLSSIPANGTRTIVDTIALFGQQNHSIYGRVDTGRNIFESDEGNNVTTRLVDAACPVQLIDLFDDGVVDPVWTQTDFGDSLSSPASSTQSEAAGVLTLSNRGTSAFTADDNGAGAGYHVMHRTVGSGPFEVSVRLDRTSIVNTSSFAGLEVRSSLAGNAEKIMFGYRNNGSLRVITRQNNGTAVSYRTVTLGGMPPVWLKIKRNGDVWTFQYNTSASTTLPSTGWTNFNNTTPLSLIMPSVVEVGLFNMPASSAAPTANHQARFRSMVICASSAPGGVSGVGTGYLGSRCGEVAENGNGLVIIDSINTILNQSGSGKSWQTVAVATPVLGEPSMEGIQVMPDTGLTMAAGVGPRATYQVKFQAAGTYYVWVAGWGPNTSGDDVHVGLNGTAIGIVDAFPTGATAPAWKKMPGSIAVSAGINTINLWGREDGARVFKILLTKNAAFTPPSDGMAQSACTILAQKYIAPLERVCTNPIQRGDFEGTFFEVTGIWATQNLATAYSTVAYQSNHGAFFPVFGNRLPKMSQAFDLPGRVLSNTTAILQLYRAADVNFSGASTTTDKIMFTMRWESEPAPPAAGFDLITPTQVVGAFESGLPDFNSGNPSNSDWRSYSFNLFNATNPLSAMEPNARVRAYFYTPTAGTGSAFYLDNVSLTFCTTQPAPQQVTGGQLSGFTRRSGVPLVGATVWAYAYSEDGSTPGPVFKTYSIQDGSFRFYNLPPGQYLIYASMNDPSGSFFATYRVPVTNGSNVANIIMNLVTS